MKTIWAALAVSLSLGWTASAQDLSPAELPPPGFEGDRYVDSRGCVFLRSQVGDVTVFVPRLTRERTLVCGEAPTLAGAAPQTQPPEPRPEAVATAPQARPASPEPRIEAAAPDITEVAPVSARDRDPKSAPVPIVEPARAAVRTARGAPVPTAPRRVRAKAPHGHAPAYIQGPTIGGEVHRVPVQHDGGAVVDAEGYVVLGRVREAVPDVHPPYGYRRAWKDGRLNPYRGPKAFAGAEQSARVWTRTVPRELRERPIGTVVTPAARAPAYAKHRHVYVGGVRDVAQARRIERQLRHLGLPVRFQRGPRELIIVLAGPYAAEHQAAAALAKVRRKGYHRAYVR